MSVARIPLCNRAGAVRAIALVDEADLPRLGVYRWHLARGYAVRWAVVAGRHTTVCMHREILGLTHGDGLQADHINGDGLDNRRANLRVVTAAQNPQNRRSVPGSTSRYRGVTWHRRASKWQATVYVNGRNVYLGLFEGEEDAARAASDFRAEHMTHTVEVPLKRVADMLAVDLLPIASIPTRKRKTHCRKGHPFDEQNTYLRPDGDRDCRACRRENNRRYDEKRRAAA